LIDPDATADTFRASFERLLAANQQRGRLLESLLTLSSSEHGLGPLEKVDLSALVRQVIRDHANEVDRHGLRVEAAMRPASVLGDPALIARLIANLYDNAIRYNVLGGVIEVGTRLDTGRALVTITNTGPIVPPDEVPRLFEPFQRLLRVSDDSHHGLGLSIVRAIVAAHSADLHASARSGGGLAIEIAFPVGAAR
jgi:signal transduction histidine kinase